MPLAIARGATAALTRRAGFAGGWQGVLVAAGGAVAALVFAPIAPIVDVATGPAGEALTARAVASEAGALLTPVTLTWTAIAGSRFLGLAHDPSPAPRAAAEAPGFLARVRPGLGTRIVALSAELHHLRARTGRGSDRVLYPFGRAVGEMAGEGLQVHRSHRVSFANLIRVERSGSAGRAVLSTGVAVPVARSRIAEVRAAL